MQSSKQMLTSVLKTAQLGKTGIQNVLRTRMGPGLRNALENQLWEYDRIESEVFSVASQRGWELQEVEPALRFANRAAVKAQLLWGSSDSEIACMMIGRNTRNMVQSLRDQNSFHRKDPQVCLLSQKLLDCENAGIRQLQRFL